MISYWVSLYIDIMSPDSEPDILLIVKDFLLSVGSTVRHVTKL